MSLKLPFALDSLYVFVDCAGGQRGRSLSSSLPDALIMPGVLGASGQRECLYVQVFVAQSGIYTGIR